MTKLTIGIDISKALLDVALHPGGEVVQFSNDKKGHKAFVKWASAFDVNLIVFEATGAYHRGLERFLGDRELAYAKVNPRHTKRFSQAIGNLAKTDTIDAKMLAKFGQVLNPSQTVTKSQTLDELGEFVRMRQALIKDRTAAKNRMHIVHSKLGQRQLKKRVKQIKSDIKEIDDACKALIMGDEVLRKRFETLMSIPGLGETTCIIMLSEMPELGTMDKKQVAALAGLAPITRQSGTWKGKSFIQGGRANLRRALYMPALVAMRHNPQLAKKYQDMISKGKPPKVALTTLMRKLIITANALIRDNRKYTEKTA